MRRLFIILILACCSSCAGRANSQVPAAPSPSASLPAPEGLVQYPSPPADGPALRCANYSAREWRVTLAGENLKISLDTRRDRQDPLPPGRHFREVAGGSWGGRHVIRVGDGWLVGLDVGEFGGGLWWFNPDGSSSKKLAGENVAGLAESSKGVLALAGLAQMGSDAGKVLRVSDGEAGHRKVEALADLGAAPRTFVAESPESLLVLTTRGLIRVRTSGVVEQLLPTNYRLLYPNSMTLSPSGVIHVGMRHFVTRMTPTGGSYREEWFVPIGCSRFSIRDDDCVCIPGQK